MSKVFDIESGELKSSIGESRSTNGESRSTNGESRSSNGGDDYVDVCVKMFVFGLLSLFILPFGIASVYYAYTDNSCVNLAAGKLYINLKDYLAVNGIMYLAHYCICLAVFRNGKRDLDNTILYQIVQYISIIFTSCWNITGAVIFWKLIDNDKCDSSIYNYVYALFVIQFVFTALTVLDKRKSKR